MNIILDKKGDFRKATLPSGSICLFSNTLYEALTSENFSRKISTLQSFKSIVNQIPRILIFGAFHFMCRCGIYLLGEFLLPSHMALVFPVFKKRPDILQKCRYSELFLQMKFCHLLALCQYYLHCCKIVCSYVFIFLLCLIILASISTHKINKYGDIGSPCLRPLSIENHYDNCT